MSAPDAALPRGVDEPLAATQRLRSVPVRGVIVTSVARIAHARHTADTFLLHHPLASALIVVVDDRFGEAEDAPTPERLTQRALTSHDLQGDAQELARISLMHAVDQRIALARPFVLSAELAVAEPGLVVVSLPDDAVVLTPLVTLVRAALDVGAGLVAVRRTPLPVDGRFPDRADLVAGGRIDAQTVSLSGSNGRALVDWWTARIHRSELDDPARLEPCMHPWMDEALFEMRPVVRVLAPTVVRSFRNLDEWRHGDDDGSPDILRFTGFVPARPWQLSELAGNWPRVLLSTRPWLAAQVDRYGAALDQLLAGWSPAVDDPYAHLPQGHAVDSVMRALYRSHVLAAERHGTPLPPNPFVAGQEEAFADWLAAGSGSVTRYLRAYADSRPDLSATFAGDDGALAQWAATDGRALGLWPRLLVPSPTPAPIADDPPSHSEAARDLAGINIIGLLTAEMGVGEVGRLVRRAVSAARIPHSLVVDEGTVNRRNQAVEPGATFGFRYDVDLVAVNADVTVGTLGAHGRSGRTERPTIGVWAWEVLEFPPSMHSAFDLLDEVWVTSHFMRQGVLAAATQHGVEVHVIPVQLPYVHMPPAQQRVHQVAAELGVPAGRPCFMFSFDHLSVAERKNPWGTVEAFRRAFPSPTNDGPVLVIKSINSGFRPMEREHLLHAIGGRPDIVLLEEYLDSEVRDVLLARTTCYVSLHRSEGLGLTMAEAMGLGIPVIATGWSGNLDFMDATCAYLVDHQLVPVPAWVDIYAGLGCWAQPDLDHAASLMRQVIAQPAEAAAVGALGREALERRNASGADAAFVIERLRAVRALNRTTRTLRRTP